VVHATTGSAERAAIGAIRMMPEANDNWLIRAWRAIWDE
jgi:hypothetical protein